MTMSFLSLWLPRLPTDRLRRIDGSVEGAALATVSKIKGAQRIVAVDQIAAAHAVRPGMSLADARAIRADLIVKEADPVAEAKTLGHVADWCGRFTPLVATDGPDGLLLDITGAAHLFGGQTALLAVLEAGLLRQGFEGKAAVAATPEAAWALARFGNVAIGPDPDDPKIFRKVMGALPTAALRLDPTTVQNLAQAGLRQIDDLLWRPRAPIAARFGEALFRRLDALMGTLKTPIGPRFDPPAFVAEQRFVSPIVSREAVELALLALAHHLGALLDRQNKGARRIEASLFRVDGVVKRMAVGTSRPLNQPQAMARLFRERIEGVGEEGLDTGYGFDLVRLAVCEAEALPHSQNDLVPRNEPDPAQTEDDLADLIDRLGARLGLGRVMRLLEQDRHIPEFAALAVPAATARQAYKDGKAPQSGKASQADEVRRADEVRQAGKIRQGTGLRHGGPDAASPQRPSRLFEHPEPIEAIASVPDGPPVRFRWRRTIHELAAIEGPERIAPEWWTAEGPSRTRDYFRAEDREGRRFWLFREGLYAQEAVSEPVWVEDPGLCPEAARPRWYLHGLFA